MIKTIDSFLFDDSYRYLKNYSLECDFKDVKNDLDGVIYPYICAETPEFIREEILSKIGGENHTIFMRMSPEGVHVPHPVHHDGVMGSKSLMLYLFDRDKSGTAFVEHAETGADRAGNEQETEIMIRDMADLSKWRVYEIAQARENRAVIFDAELMHAALPVGGFGLSQSDARIVLTVFYD